MRRGKKTHPNFSDIRATDNDVVGGWPNSIVFVRFEPCLDFDRRSSEISKMNYCKTKIEKWQIWHRWRNKLAIVTISQATCNVCITIYTKKNDKKMASEIMIRLQSVCVESNHYDLCMIFPFFSLLIMSIFGVHTKMGNHLATIWYVFRSDNNIATM